MAWSKKAAVGIGVAMGLLATFTAMLPSSHKSEAAIAVIDQQNIEEAAKTAIQTAKILTEEQKKYALMLLQLKKIDGNFLETVAQDQLKHLEEMKTRDIVYPQGALDYGKATEAVWLDRLGDLNAVLNGDITIYDEVQKEKTRQQTLDQTYKAGVEEAKQEILKQYSTSKLLQEATDKSNNAEGEVQAIQAGNIILANGVDTQMGRNRILAHILANQSATMKHKMMQEAIEEAKAEREQQDAENHREEALEALPEEGDAGTDLNTMKRNPDAW